MSSARDVMTGSLQLIAPVVLIVVVAAAVVVTVGRSAADPLASALSTVPADTGTADITVWGQLPGDVDDASLSGLTDRSAIAAIADDVQSVTDLQLTELDWELFARTVDGPVTVLGLGSIDAAALANDLSRLGTRQGPVIEIDAARAPSPDFVTAFRYVRVLKARKVLVAGETAAAVNSVVSTITGTQRSLLTNRDVAAASELLARKASVMLRDRRAWCADVELDEDDVRIVRSREKATTALVDPAWGGRGLSADGSEISFAVTFDNADTARRQQQIRLALTRGPFVGRSATVERQLSDRTVRLRPAAMAFDFRPTDEAENFMVDVTREGFNGCAVTSPS